MEKILGTKRNHPNDNNQGTNNLEQSSISAYNDLKNQIKDSFDKNNIQDVILKSIALVNSNFSKIDRQILVRDQEVKKLLNLIRYISNYEVKTYLMIFLNGILEKENSYIYLNLDELRTYFSEIYQCLQEQENYNDKILYAKEIFRQLMFIDPSNHLLFQILEEQDVLNLLEGILRSRQQIQSVNSVLYVNLFTAFLDFMDIVTENDVLTQKNSLQKKIASIFFKSIEQQFLNDQIDVLIFQQVINLYNNNIDLSDLDSNYVNKLMNFIWEKILQIFKKYFDLFIVSKQELLSNVPIEWYNVDQHILDHMDKMNSCFIFFIKFFESDLVEKVNINGDLSNSFISSLINLNEWDSSFLEKLFEYLKQKKTDFWVLIEKIHRNQTKVSTMFINFSHSLISSVNQLEIIINHFWNELRKQSYLIYQNQELFQQSQFNKQLIEENIKTLLVYLEILNSQEDKTNIQYQLDECLNIFHFYFSNKQDYNQLENLFDCVNQFCAYSKKHNSQQIQQNLEKIVQYILEVLNLQEIESSFLKSSALNLIFTVFSDEEFHEYYLNQQLQSFLGKILEELQTKLKFNAYLQNHEKMENLEESVENLEMFLDYKENL